MTRTKFKCDNVTEFAGGLKRAVLTAVTGGSEENEMFWRYTPAGDITLHIDNPVASAMFVPGQEYYVDLSPADAATDGQGPPR